MSNVIANHTSSASVIALDPRSRVKSYLAETMTAALVKRVLRKQDALESIGRERSTAASARYEKGQAIIGVRQKIQQQIAEVESTFERLGVSPNEKERAHVQLLKERVQELNAELAEIRGHKEPSTLNEELTLEWLSTLNGSYHDAAVSLPKGKDPEDAREKALNTMRSLEGERIATLKSPLPPDTAFEPIRLAVETAAEEGRPRWESAARLVSIGRDPKLQRQGLFELPTLPYETGQRTIEVNNGVGLLLWLHKDAVLEKIRAEMNAFYKGKTPLSRTDRDAKLAEIDAAILAAGRVEEAAIEALEARGARILRRHDADLHAVFGIERA